jgi:hypothetical protein
MDSSNRDATMAIMGEVARGMRNKQFFFLTPLCITSLEARPDQSILRLNPTDPQQGVIM